MTEKSSKMLIASGRVLLAIYFLLPGLGKLLAPDMQLALMQHHNIPFAMPLLYIAGIAQVVGAFLVLSNRHVRKTALGFVLYVLIINFTLHDFWNFTGVEGGHELQNFVKNLGVLAGLLVLAGISPVRKIALKSLFNSDSKL